MKKRYLIISALILIIIVILFTVTFKAPQKTIIKDSTMETTDNIPKKSDTKSNTKPKIKDLTKNINDTETNDRISENEQLTQNDHSDYISFVKYARKNIDSITIAINDSIYRRIKNIEVKTSSVNENKLYTLYGYDLYKSDNKHDMTDTNKQVVINENTGGFGIITGNIILRLVTMENINSLVAKYHCNIEYQDSNLNLLIVSTKKSLIDTQALMAQNPYIASAEIEIIESAPLPK